MYKCPNLFFANLANFPRDTTAQSILIVLRRSKSLRFDPTTYAYNRIITQKCLLLLLLQKFISPDKVDLSSCSNIFIWTCCRSVVKRWEGGRSGDRVLMKKSCSRTAKEIRKSTGLRLWNKVCGPKVTSRMEGEIKRRRSFLFKSTDFYKHAVRSRQKTRCNTKIGAHLLGLVSRIHTGG